MADSEINNIEFNNKIDVFFVFSPFILITFFVLLSIFHIDLKIIIMSVGLSSMLYLYKLSLSSYLTRENSSIDSNIYKDLCTSLNTFEIPGSSLAIMAFIFSYTFLPMTVNNNYNYLMIITLLLFIVMEIYYKIFVYKCFNYQVIIISLIFGLLSGIGWFGFIKLQGDDYNNLLYYNISKFNHVQCTRPTNVTWECEDIPS